jgi:CoA transferase family III
MAASPICPSVIYLLNARPPASANAPAIRFWAMSVAIQDKFRGAAPCYRERMATGPLKGVKVLEFAGLGPGPFTGMMLSDMGADVLRIVRPGTADPLAERFDARGRLRCSRAIRGWSMTA